MQFVTIGEAFDGGDIGTIDRGCQCQAGDHALVADQYCACSAGP